MSLRTLMLSALLPLTLINPALAADRECAQSPDHGIELCVFVKDGQAYYEVNRKGLPVLAPGKLGLDFKGEAPARYSTIRDVKRSAADSTWEQPWGEQRLVRDNHTELAVTLVGDTPLNAQAGVVFRLFDDGIGFRYVYDAIPAGQDVNVVSEQTQFRPVGPQTAWWYEGLAEAQVEYLYTKTDARRIALAETPLTLKGQSGLHLAIHEAALVDFPSMLLAGDGTGTLTAKLMPWPDGVLARKNGPFTTPWRTVLITDNAGALADSRMELNLNEPNRLGDVSWFKPGKYVGVWWAMHLTKSTWGSGPAHGANNDNVKHYMDFAAKHGFTGVLVEGWNKGWDGDWVAHGDQFSFTQSYPDFDLPALTAYGRAKGVGLIGHNETAGAIVNYERQLDDAMALYHKVGVHAVKTGYVKESGTIVDEQGALQWFAGQYMVRHHLHVIDVAARNQIAIDTHEPVKDTGLRRTYPNWVSREGARGQEYNAWGKPTNPPEHVTILPFTRMLAGPMDYTPGIFDLTFGKDKPEARVQSTLATQLALYVVLYSPVQMAADLPENYEVRPDAFQFIREVAVDWESSRTLQGEIGDYVVVARQARGSKEWFLGAVTDEVARKLTQKLDFLTQGKRYEAQIYADGAGADYRTNPTALKVEKRVLTSADSLELDMAPGGGVAVRFKPL